MALVIAHIVPCFPSASRRPKSTDSRETTLQRLMLCCCLEESGAQPWGIVEVTPWGAAFGCIGPEPNWKKKIHSLRKNIKKMRLFLISFTQKGKHTKRYTHKCDVVSIISCPHAFYPHFPSSQQIPNGNSGGHSPYKKPWCCRVPLPNVRGCLIV